MALLIDVLAAGVIDSSGNPLDSGVVYVYEVGTTTPVTTYQDAALSQAHSNPIVLDSVGKAEVYTNTDVRLVIEDADGANVADIDAIGSNTELIGGTTTIGTTQSDVLELNASIEGDLIPTVDDTYDVGSDSKRWAEGHFVDLEADTLTGATLTGGELHAIAATTPRWISNLGIDLDAGVLKVVSANGNVLSATNYGYVTCKAATNGLVVPLKCTFGGSIQDFTATSNFTNFDFGIIETADQTNVRFYVYVANRADSDVDGVDGSSAYFVSIDPGLDVTPSSANNIGDTGAVPATDSAASIIFMQNVTIADYVDLPCTLIAAFEMDWDTSDNDWTIQAFSAEDGIGSRLPLTTKFANDSWEKVTRATGATATKRGIAITAESAAVSETTVTDQSIGVTATLTTTGRPVFVGLTCNENAGFIKIDTGTTTNPIDCRIKLKRDGTEIYEATFTAAIAGSNDTFGIPPSSIWTIDNNGSAGTYAYTATIALLNTGTSAGCSVNNIVIVAFEL